MIQKSAVNKILGFEPISDHICKLRVKVKLHNMTLINMYAPTENKEEEIKEKFYEELQRTQDRKPKHDLIIILGDMNAKLEKEKVSSQTISRHTLHNVSNENGDMVANYAISNNMFLVSTNFQHKKIHLGTWISPDQQTINQIDHVIVSKGKMRLIHDVRSKRGYNCYSDHFLIQIKIMKLIHDVRSKRGYNCDSDHFLIQIKIKQKLMIVKNRQTLKYKWDRQTLNIKEKISQYQEKIQSKLQEIGEETDINQNWQNLKQIILEAASKDSKNTNHWWDDECKKAIQEKNEARQKCLIRRTRTNLDNYQPKKQRPIEFVEEKRMAR
jgi:hypothetical protein